MEDELRSFVNLNYGPNAWNEVIRLQADIRLKKKEAEENRKLKVEQMQENIVVGLIVLVLVTAAVYVAFIILNAGN